VLGSGHVEAGGAVIVDLLPGPASQLTAAGNRAPDGPRDGLERHAKYVVQHEDDPLGGAEPLQHDQQGQPDVVVEGDPVGRVARRPAVGWRLAA
jgi:hypothetical protein